MNTLKAEKRSMDVKAKKLRREGYVTGNLFGREIEGFYSDQDDEKGSRSAAEDGQQRKSGYAGSRRQDQYDALIKEVDYNAMTSRVDEIDFQALVSTEKVHSVAEIVLLNHEKVAGRCSAGRSGRDCL